MKIQTINPKELPYYGILSAIRRAVDRIEEETGRFTITGPCVSVSRLVSEFIPELQQLGGIYVPLCTGHAFNYDTERKLNIDLSMDQFDWSLKSEWTNEKILAERRTRKKKSLTDKELWGYECAKRGERSGVRTGYLLGDFKLDDCDKPENLLRYGTLDNIPYRGIPKIVVMPEDKSVLKDYPMLTYRIARKMPDIGDLITRVESELARKAA